MYFNIGKQIFSCFLIEIFFLHSYFNDTEVKRSSYQMYHEYLQGGLSYLDLENEKDSDLITQIRQYFARFIYKFINQIPRRLIYSTKTFIFIFNT